MNDVSCAAKTTSSLNSKGNLDSHFNFRMPLLNYHIHIGKIYFWSSSMNEVLPNIDSFIVKVNSK